MAISQTMNLEMQNIVAKIGIASLRQLIRKLAFHNTFLILVNANNDITNIEKLY